MARHAMLCVGVCVVRHLSTFFFGVVVVVVKNVCVCVKF